MPTASSSITWSHDFDSALTRARQAKRDILLDFTPRLCEPAALGWRPRCIRIHR
jgi:hypothetical protein